MLTLQTSMGLGESLLISVVGMLVVMLELFLLYLFVRLLAAVAGKTVGRSKKAPPVITPTAGTAVEPEQTDENVIEMAAALAAAFAEVGVTPDANQTMSINAVNVN